MRRRTFIKLSLSSLFAFFGMATFPGFYAHAKDPKLCIVLDDAGSSNNNISLLEKLADENIPITISVLPKTHYDKKVLNILAEYENADIFLHQPMEPLDMVKRDLQEGLETTQRKKGERFNPNIHSAIYDFDSEELAIDIIDKNIKYLNDYLKRQKNARRIIGLNNHMGSLITGKRKDILESIAKYCKKNNLILLDSRSNSDSIMYGVCKKIWHKTYENHRFIDNNTLDKLKNCEKNAKQGYDLIVIGHLQDKYTIDGIIQFSKESNILSQISRLEKRKTIFQ